MTPDDPSRGGSQARPPAHPRPATREDLDAMGRLGGLLMRRHHELDPRRFIPATAGIDCDYAAFLGGQLDDPDVAILVAERDGEVVGYTYAAIEGPDCMALRGPAAVLHDLVVDPGHRKSGVGRILLEATLSALRARGVPRVVLSTAEKNDAAKRLFAEAGFRPTMVEMTQELNDNDTVPPEETEMDIQKAGSRPSVQGPEDWFTGRVRIDFLFDAREPARAAGAAVTFEPGARTAWHSHPLGQTLIVTSGLGLVQREGGAIEEIRPGDVVWFEPGEKHWHGASPSVAMTHIAIQEAREGKAVEWLEHVTDEQYPAVPSGEPGSTTR